MAAVCERLGQLPDAIGRYASSFDASLVSVEQAGLAVVEAAAIEKMAATLKGLAAARCAARGRGLEGSGRPLGRSPSARTTGTSVSQATDAIETARRLDGLPALSAAARAGQLSGAQVAAVADAAAVDPSAEDRLVDKARSGSLGELREGCARAEAAARPDAEARRPAIDQRRFLRSYTTPRGAWHLHMRDNPEVGAEVMAAIDAIRDRVSRAARAEGRHEPSKADAADPRAELARTGGGGSRRPRAKILVREWTSVACSGPGRAR